MAALYDTIESALQPTTAEFFCKRCRNIRQSEADFPDNFTRPTRLRIGSGSEVEYIRIPPLMASILDRLVAGRGKVQSHDTIIFHSYSTGARRAGQRDDEPERPLKTIRVMVCRFRKELAKLKQKVRIETRFGQGLVLVSDVPEIVLELQ